MNGEHGQSEQTTTHGTATDSDETATPGSDTTTDSSDTATDSAGGAGIEAQEGTQAGEEPNPEEETDTQTQ